MILRKTRKKQWLQKKMNNNKFYITTTLAYVNADLHIGHAAEFIRADVLARYKRKMGYDVFFNTGVDEHGQKIFNTARELGEEPQVFVDKMFERVKSQVDKMNISYTSFTRTTDKLHKQSAQAFWKKCEENGDIYKKAYKTKYCVGCELEKTDSELINGECPLHPGKQIEEIEEENYFFKFSKYQGPLLELYKNNPDFVIPDFRLNEISKFVGRGLKDFSISRLKDKMPWGVPVPGDEQHVMYVWFDALVNYISVIGWPEEEEFNKWWPVFQVAGKDNLRQQSAMWQAMLMSAGLKPSKQIHIFGFINSDGQKMSKSLGNVINPLDIIDEYGTDALRYYVLSHASMYDDSDVTLDKFKEIYNGNLANGLGNLVSRIMKMTETYEIKADEGTLSLEFCQNSNLDNFNPNKAMEDIWEKIQYLDGYIQKTEPFKKIKVDKEGAIRDLKEALHHLMGIAVSLEPFMPETSQKIQVLIKTDKAPDEPLFLRK